MEWQLEPGAVIDVPGLPPLRVILSDPPGTLRVLQDAMWQPKMLPLSANPYEWAPVGDSGWEARLVLVGSMTRAMVRPAGGALPPAANG